VTGIAKTTVHEVISYLNFCKVSTRWDLKMITEAHRRKRISALLENLCLYQDGESFVDSIINGKCNMGLRVHPRVQNTFHDLETSSFTH
jgi:hypothetical protein